MKAPTPNNPIISTEKLQSMALGDQFEYGSLLPGLDQGSEPMVWSLMGKQTEPFPILFFKVFYYEVPIFKADVHLTGDTQAWSISEILS